MPTNRITDAIETSRQAWLKAQAAIATAKAADVAVREELLNQDLRLTGYTTHEFVLLGTNIERRQTWVSHDAHVLAVAFDLSQDPPLDSLLVRRPDDSMWLIPVRETDIGIAPEG
jgi:hypothetical protein